MFKGTVSPSVPVDNVRCMSDHASSWMERLTRVVGTANRSNVTEIVLNIDISRSLHAKLLGQLWVGEMKLAIRATLQTSHRLRIGPLLAWPLGLLKAWWAGIRAHGSSAIAILAAITRDSSIDVGDEIALDLHVLDTRPAADVHPIDGDCTILFRES